MSDTTEITKLLDAIKTQRAARAGDTDNLIAAL